MHCVHWSSIAAIRLPTLYLTMMARKLWKDLKGKLFFLIWFVNQRALHNYALSVGVVFIGIIDVMCAHLSYPQV